MTILKLSFLLFMLLSCSTAEYHMTKKVMEVKCITTEPNGCD